MAMKAPTRPGTTIVTLTMNPALDITTHTDRVIPTDKVRCGLPRYDPGGGGINVARIAHVLGASVSAIFPAGGHAGDKVTDLVADSGVPVQRITVAHSTRESFTVDENTHRAAVPVRAPRSVAHRCRADRVPRQTQRRGSIRGLRRGERQSAARCAYRLLSAGRRHLSRARCAADSRHLRGRTATYLFRRLSAQAERARTTRMFRTGTHHRVRAARRGARTRRPRLRSVRRRVTRVQGRSACHTDWQPTLFAGNGALRQRRGRRRRHDCRHHRGP